MDQATQLALIAALETIAPALITFLAGYIGVRYGIKQLRLQKRLDFRSRQLDEFYSPLLGIQKSVDAKSELRLRISRAADAAWHEKAARAPTPWVEHDQEFEPFKRIIQYENVQLRRDLIPLYHRMLETFREKYWLAEPSTREWLGELSDFVELWDRWLGDNIPPEVIEQLDHGEQRLRPFYAELEHQMNVLRAELSD